MLELDGGTLELKEVMLELVDGAPTFDDVEAVALEELCCKLLEDALTDVDEDELEVKLLD